MMNLSTLPADVIRIIVLMEKPESIDHMRLISPGWNAMVLGTLSNRKQLPEISHLIWSRTQSGLDPIKTVDMKRRSQYWNEESFYEDRGCTEVIQINDPKFAAKLRRCSHIDTLELNKWMIFDNIRDYLCEIPVRKIRADQITFEAQGTLLAMIRLHQVQHLEITAHLFKKRNLHEFIIQSMECLHSIKLFELIPDWDRLSQYVPTEVSFEDLARELNNSLCVRAHFYPDNIQTDFHWLHVQRIVPTQ
ncbi:hypothetical protein PRIPAC_70869 [Pristionchus pacificus]|uniref:Uncharacterized protein n=1 Tax=Pristionchus pacificus TaxID=54126 RepID=A0A2A6BRE4_PRIPA|nr:hypothetical protein PRIPAC_70869 [Pristionchus pacificus]|eukprot:PDM68494.1 hypothetical protein PRIPAC_43996 [Pristionchus pacificus]